MANESQGVVRIQGQVLVQAGLHLDPASFVRHVQLVLGAHKRDTGSRAPAPDLCGIAHDDAVPAVLGCSLAGLPRKSQYDRQGFAAQILETGNELMVLKYQIEHFALDFFKAMVVVRLVDKLLQGRLLFGLGFAPPAIRMLLGRNGDPFFTSFARTPVRI